MKKEVKDAGWFVLTALVLILIGLGCNDVITNNIVVDPAEECSTKVERVETCPISVDERQVVVEIYHSDGSVTLDTLNLALRVDSKWTGVEE